ncbi:MAG: Asp-tRNA(Asn)/Glu-tRNA(Gln) amidotransferase subunit GatB [Oscillospiraceae bacterium]|jgi:aspartyl-tRNA(Asn)/glutamyl-tRNA(Gln) amidotransferase subunit B|nr:Asp-tRNA(Asn)/Glu-tRNA(Gln) amidotransferase subunit GatB [Oscillospiraceae bacterium]
MKYELVCGLETHVELSTKTKIFCGCRSHFGSEPNTNCCPICIGLPGTLPKLNKEVVRYAIMAGLATHCEINLISKMDRKNYVYPDLPKAYQISQYDLPLCKNGYVELESGKKIRINRIHIEEDAGKLVHKGQDVLIDYNRGGVPLIEIVTHPDISSSDEAKEYIEKLQSIMRYIDVSDCKMQEGSMRCDVNISVRHEGETKLGVRTEIKNMNSITFITKAIDYETERQIDAIQSGGEIYQETLRYSEETNSTESMRNKENANDYRYFGEPDLITIKTNKEDLEKYKTQLPEFADGRCKRYVNDYDISKSDAKLLVKYKKVSDFFEKSIKGIDKPKTVSNLILGVIFRYIENESDKQEFNIKVLPEDLNKLVLLMQENKININLAKKALGQMMETGKKVSEVIPDDYLQEISGEEIKEICKKVIKSNDSAVKDYLSGKDKALKFLLGQVMKETKGKADAKFIEKILAGEIKNA